MKQSQYSYFISLGPMREHFHLLSHRGHALFRPFKTRKLNRLSKQLSIPQVIFGAREQTKLQAFRRQTTALVGENVLGDAPIPFNFSATTQSKYTANILLLGILNVATIGK